MVIETCGAKILLLAQFVRKNIFIVLKMMIYGIYICGLTFQSVDHKIRVPTKTDCLVSMNPCCFPILFSASFILSP